MCMEENGGTLGGQENIKDIERESSGVLCNASLTLLSGDSGTDREATTNAAGLQKQLDQEDSRSEEVGSWKDGWMDEGGDRCEDESDREIGEELIEVGWTPGADGVRENGKESGQVEGARE